MPGLRSQRARFGCVVRRIRSDGDLTVVRAHPDATATSGAASSGARSASTRSTRSLAPGATRPVGAGTSARTRSPIRSVCASSAISIASSTRVRGGGSRASARSTSRPKTITCAPGSRTRSRSRRSRPVSLAQPASASRSSRRSRSRTTAATVPPGTRRRRRSRRTSPAATTTRSTAPTSRSRRSTCASRRSTASATTRGAGPRRPRPKAKWSPGPIGSPTSATTSPTPCGPGSSTPDDLPPEIADGRRAAASRARSARSCAPCSTRSTRTGHVGMTEPAATRLRRFRAFNFERIYLRPAACRQAEKVIGLLRGLVDFFLDAPAPLAGRRHGHARGPRRRDRPRRPRWWCATSAA